jgi:hypothetical protein
MLRRLMDAALASQQSWMVGADLSSCRTNSSPCTCLRSMHFCTVDVIGGQPIGHTPRPASTLDALNTELIRAVTYRGLTRGRRGSRIRSPGVHVAFHASAGARPAIVPRTCVVPLQSGSARVSESISFWFSNSWKALTPPMTQPWVRASRPSPPSPVCRPPP